MSSSVEDWLRSLGFIHYTQAFLDNGYDELDICKEIGKEDLDAIGVRNFKDRTDILNAVERLKQSGTAVYFVLEGNVDSESLAAQPERESYPPIQLKMMLRDKLEEDKIDLTALPYTLPDGSEGSLDTLVTLYADKFYTYEDQVLSALRSLRQRQAEKEEASDLPVPVHAVPLSPPVTCTRVFRHSSKHSSRGSKGSDKEGHGVASEDEDKTSPARAGMNPADYLDVESPFQRGNKKSKKRRKVERNTKLSRSLDSLKELHVNVDPKTREREQSSFKSRFKLFHGTKKKHHSTSSSDMRKQALEKKLSNPNTTKDYDLLASAIKMSEEDRMALMIMVKQGELTVEEAVEQLKKYEEDCRKGDYIKPKSEEIIDDEKSEKPKLKRGLFGRSTKRKSGSRPSSEFIACEMTTMSEEERINLMRCVKSGEMSVDQALKRFISYEEKHKKSDSDDSAPQKASPKLPKSASGFSRISIKRVSGVLSSSFKLPTSSVNEPNAVFYTGEDGRSVDGSVSSGDEVLGIDSSPAPSPLLANVQGVNKSQRSSSSSVDSLEKVEEKSAPIPMQNQQPNFLSEMKVVLGKQNRSESRERPEDAVHPDLKSLRVCDKYQKPPPPPPGRKTSMPLVETQKIVPPPNPTPSLNRNPPVVPIRPGPAVAQPHRPPPPVPLRPSKSSDDVESQTAIGKKVQPELNNTEAGPAKPDLTKFKNDSRQSETKPRLKSVNGQAGLEREKLEQNNTGDVVLKRPNKPPPLPPRPTSSNLNEKPDIAEGRDESQATLLDSEEKVSQTESASDVSGREPPVVKPNLKPKPKPRPRPRPKMEDDEQYKVPAPRPVRVPQKKEVQTSDSDDDAYNPVPPPRPVGRVTGTNDTSDKPHNQVLPPRPVGQSQGEKASDSDDEPYTAVPPPRPVVSPGGTRTQGEPSGNGVQTNMERDNNELLAGQNIEQKLSRSESGGDKIPVPAPRIKRPSHSLSEMVERKLHLERIDLTQRPYSDDTGSWGVPVNLVDRYAEELHRSQQELAGIIDKIRVRKLRLAGQQATSCNVSELDFTSDPLGNLESLSDWLTSLGLPMYYNGLKEVEYDDMGAMPYMEEKHFLFAGISDPRHMRRLLASVQRMPR